MPRYKWMAFAREMGQVESRLWAKTLKVAPTSFATVRTTGRVAAIRTGSRDSQAFGNGNVNQIVEVRGAEL